MDPADGEPTRPGTTSRPATTSTVPNPAEPTAADPSDDDGGAGERSGGRAALALALLTLTGLLVAAGAFRLRATELLPPLALLDGIRMPAGPPRLWAPFGPDVAWGYWLADVAGALVALLACWRLVRATALRPGGRGRRAARMILDVAVAVLAGCVVRAVATTFLTGDQLVPGLLLVGGTVLFGLLVGLLAGIVVALVASLAPTSRPTSPGLAP